MRDHGGRECSSRETVIEIHSNDRSGPPLIALAGMDTNPANNSFNVTIQPR
jgi:hypothetical protein